MQHKTNIDGLVKDLNTNVIVNNNNSEYQLYLQNKMRSKQTKNLQNEIDNVKKEISEIKNLLQQVLNGTNHV